MAIIDQKVSTTYGGVDIASLGDRPNEDGLSAAQLKARFDLLPKEVVSKYNGLIDLLVALLSDGNTTNGHTHNIDNIVDGVTYKLFTAIEEAKLLTIAENAEVNQNAYSKIKVGASTIDSTAKTDTFEIIAGLNITATINASKQITLSASGVLATEAVQSIIVDIGEYFTSLNVEGALQEIGLKLNPSTSKTTPVDADTILIADSEASGLFKKLTWENIKATLKTYFDTLYNLYVHPTNHAPSIITQDTTNRFVTDAEKTTWNAKQEALVSATNIKTVNGESLLGSGNLSIDWNIITATLTYASADSPTFVANTSVDLTALISVGMKLKLTQTTVKYFIVTAITSTTITLYGGTDYTLANATITLPSFSSMKAPFGFPLDRAKWTVRFEEGTTEFSQASPTQNTWYNMYSISVPIGLWDIEWSGIIAVISTASQTGVRVQGTLSTANNSESNNNLTAYQGLSGASSQLICIAGVMRKDLISLAVKTTHYLNIRTTSASSAVATLTNAAANQPTIIQAVCAYL